MTYDIQKIIKIAILVIVVAGIGVAAASFLQESQEKEQHVALLPVSEIPPRERVSRNIVSQMEELGYVEGENITYIREGPVAPNPQGLEELKNIYQKHAQKENVDMVFVNGLFDAPIAKEAFPSSVPIVGYVFVNPVERGLVNDLSQPKTNVTGVTSGMSAIVPKTLETIQRFFPEVERIGLLSDGFMVPGPDSTAPVYVNALRENAKNFGFELVEYTTNVSPQGGELQNELENTLNNINRGDVDAWVHVPGHFLPRQFIDERDKTAELKIPMIVPTQDDTDPATGRIAGLLGHGPNLSENGRQAAVIADKILRGTSAGSIPIESPRTFDLIINLNMAEKIGFEVPSELLNSATKIQE